MNEITTTCRQVKHDLSLLAGRDLTDRDRIEAVRRHLAVCPQCRAKYRNLRNGLSVLATNGAVTGAGAASDGGTWVAPDRSLWPELAERLPPRGQATPSSVWSTAAKNWPPVVAMAAACGVLAVVLASPFQGAAPATLTSQPIEVAAPPEQRPRIRQEKVIPAESPGYLRVDFDRQAGR